MVKMEEKTQHVKHEADEDNALTTLEDEIDAFVDSIWDKYDADNSGGIDVDETQQRTEDSRI